MITTITESHSAIYRYAASPNASKWCFHSPSLLAIYFPLRHPFLTHNSFPSITIRGSVVITSTHPLFPPRHHLLPHPIFPSHLLRHDVHNCASSQHSHFRYGATNSETRHHRPVHLPLYTSTIIHHLHCSYIQLISVGIPCSDWASFFCEDNSPRSPLPWTTDRDYLGMLFGCTLRGLMMDFVELGSVDLG